MLPELFTVVLCEKGMFKISFSGSEEGCDFLFFIFHGLSHLCFSKLATVPRLVCITQNSQEQSVNL